jgi:hypothetical protein
MLNKLLMAAAIFLGSASAYFFFYERNLVWGSITILLSVFFSLAYAMKGSVNKLPDEKIRK